MWSSRHADAFVVMMRGDPPTDSLLSGLDLSVTEAEGRGLIHFACDKNAVAWAEEMSDHLEQKDGRGDYPVHHAARHNSVDVLKLMPNVTLLDAKKNTPLAVGVANGYYIKLLDTDEARHMVNENGYIALQVAFHSGHTTCVISLIDKLGVEHLIDSNDADCLDFVLDCDHKWIGPMHGDQYLLRALAFHDHQDIIRVLIKHGAPAYLPTVNLGLRQFDNIRTLVNALHNRTSITWDITPDQATTALEVLVEQLAYAVKAGTGTFVLMIWQLVHLLAKGANPSTAILVRVLKLAFNNPRKPMFVDRNLATIYCCLHMMYPRRFITHVTTTTGIPMGNDFLRKLWAHGGDGKMFALALIMRPYLMDPPSELIIQLMQIPSIGPQYYIRGKGPKCDLIKIACTIALPQHILDAKYRMDFQASDMHDVIARVEPGQTEQLRKLIPLILEPEQIQLAHQYALEQGMSRWCDVLHQSKRSKN